jgi:hypothetical protein
MKRSLALVRVLLAFGAAARAAAPVAGGTADEIIAKARDYLGGDAALSAVHSLHFSGVIETRQMTPTGPVTQKDDIEIIFQKPYQQRVVVTRAQSIQCTALDDYVAWQREQDRTDPARFKQSVLGPDIIKWLRAMTWENLNFHKGIEKEGGTAEVVGAATVDGHAAVKVAFAHDPKIVFLYYFDPATGKLVLTETNDGIIREEGEILVNGLRFPQKEIQAMKGRDARGQPVERSFTVTFDKITLNETFPNSFFEPPVLPFQERLPAVKLPGLPSIVAPAGLTGGK